MLKLGHEQKVNAKCMMFWIVLCGRGLCKMLRAGALHNVVILAGTNLGK
jgi:hypothetical protein